MRPEVTSKHLEGIVDLVLTAPIKPGLIDAMETRTYESRLRTLLRTLNTLRVASRERASIRPFSEVVDRIQSIESFRLSILADEKKPEEKKLLLAVTFDHAWEPYIRKIWYDLGPLLDPIFCNCDGYVTAFDNTMAKYVKWIRDSQVETEYFYAGSAHTVSDLQYFRQTEKLQREQAPSAAVDEAATKLVLQRPEAIAEEVRHKDLPESVKQGLAALTALHRLTELYPSIAANGTPSMDGRYLLRATHALLKELHQDPMLKPILNLPPVRKRFGTQLAWFEQPIEPHPQLGSDPLVYRPQDVQGGIVSKYDGVSRGALLLIQVTEPSQARAFLGALPVDAEGAAGPLHVNVALTLQGLRKLGVPEPELAAFPKEFREGMEARAGLLGDVRANHPLNWTLPERNWPQPQKINGAVARVPLASVDIVVQLRLALASALGASDYEIVGNPVHPLHQQVADLAGKPGIKLLSVQTTVSYRERGGLTREHFGFIDGISQPVVSPNRTGNNWDDAVPRGELLLGYRNHHKDPPPGANPLLDNGTFLVVRKLKQDVEAFHDFVESSGIPGPDIKAKMMGRTTEGIPVDSGATLPINDFDYEGDKEGAKCPFQAHIRRANPRRPAPPGERKPMPRIMRRGMSYGPRFDPKSPSADERGIVFMAYAASIAEQFEVIQRWLTGGNSSDVLSLQSDPICGVPMAGDTRTFRFLRNGTPARVEIDKDPRQFVRLEWGTYLFVPSIPAIATIAAGMQHPPSDQIRQGEEIIQKLLAMEGAGVPGPVIRSAWKGVLEDVLARLAGHTAAVWAAIRANHGGVLKTRDYGVLVGTKSLVSEVYLNDQARYSVSGYQVRMQNSIGEIYLGLDAGPRYDAESAVANTAIGAISEQAAFLAARGVTKGFLDALVPPNAPPATFDVKELSDVVLGGLCRLWFDMPDGTHVMPGGWQAEASPALCPGHWTSPSKYFFQPNPGPGGQGFGDRHGQALRAKMRAFIQAARGGSGSLAGAISRPIFDATPDDDLCARTIVGVMMGFLPTVDGNFRSTMYEWLDERKTLWTLQDGLVANGTPVQHAHAAAVLRTPLMQAMQRRPAPDMVWRTATADHALGPVQVKKDERIVVGIVSATSEDLENGTTDVFAVFGGDRSANPHPTHACPGYKAAMGVMMGMLTGLLEAGTLRPAAAPLTLTLVR